MGFFRRHKLSDYTADECREELARLQGVIKRDVHLGIRGVKLLEEWACFRELLARHEGKNKSQLDT